MHFSKIPKNSKKKKKIPKKKSKNENILEKKKIGIDYHE